MRKSYGILTDDRCCLSKSEIKKEILDLLDEVIDEKLDEIVEKVTTEISRENKSKVIYKGKTYYPVSTKVKATKQGVYFYIYTDYATNGKLEVVRLETAWKLVGETFREDFTYFSIPEMTFDDYVNEGYKLHYVE